MGKHSKKKKIENITSKIDASLFTSGKVSDEELFLKAIEELEPSDMYAVKYGGREVAPEKPEDPMVYREEKESKKESPKPKVVEPPKKEWVWQKLALEQREQEKNLSERDDFMHLMRYQMDQIDLFDHSKYYEQTHLHRPVVSDEPSIQRMIETEPLPTDTQGLMSVRLMRYQGELLERYDKCDLSLCSEINLRQLRFAQALSELKDEVEFCYRKGKKFLAVVTGKGVHSSKLDGPVIKKGVIDWIEFEGYMMVRGYAPKLSADGNYGTIIIEIRKRDRL